MLNSKDLSRHYVKLYEHMREYVWDADTVEALAELEIAVYSRFPDIDSVQRKLSYLVSLIRSVISENDELSDVITQFSETLNSCEGTYSELPRVKEVTVNADNHEDISSEENQRKQYKLSARIHRKQ